MTIRGITPASNREINSHLKCCKLSMWNRLVCLQLNLMDDFRLSGLLQFTMDLLDFSRDKAIMHITARPPSSSQWWAHITDNLFSQRTKLFSHDQFWAITLKVAWRSCPKNHPALVPEESMSFCKLHLIENHPSRWQENLWHKATPT